MGAMFCSADKELMFEWHKGMIRVIAHGGCSSTMGWKRISVWVAIQSDPCRFQELGLEDESGWACEDWGRGGDDFRQREQSARAPRGGHLAWSNLAGGWGTDEEAKRETRLGGQWKARGLFSK